MLSPAERNPVATAPGSDLLSVIHLFHQLCPTWVFAEAGDICVFFEIRAVLVAEFDGFVRKLVTYMMEDPRTISASLDLLFLAKAVERIGDHAKNIAELIIYIVKGTDVRHSPMDVIETAAQAS